MTRLRCVGVAVCGLALAGGGACGKAASPRGRFIVISLDTLRADHLGAYGYARPTSPFFDSLTARGTLFENAIVQLPGTLPSHMSIFTGLYPAEHAVYPPDAVLSPRILTLPEVFRAHGFRTVGHSEGGYMEGRYGFARGFEEWSEESPLIEVGGELVKSKEAVRRTFRRGLESLERMRGAQAFFLFLHTYSTHDPYDPPDAYRSLFWKDAPPPGAFAPTGLELTAFNRGQRRLAPNALEYYRALYDGQIRYTDDVLKDFFAGLSRLGLDHTVTVILTSDHGEEFLEHGRMVHEQVCQETLHVPLLVLRPEQTEARRVAALVQSVDIAPTLYAMAGIPPEGRPPVSGRSLLGLLGGAAAAGGGEAYAEAFVTRDRVLYRQDGDRLLQLVQREPRVVENGIWVSRSVWFETFAPSVRFWAASYRQPRELVIRADGVRLGSGRVDPEGEWFEFRLSPREDRRRVELSSPTCTVPKDVGEGDDPRCLSFRVKELGLHRWELYDLTADPRGVRDLSSERAAVTRELARRLAAYERGPIAAPGRESADREREERLRALGYAH